MVLFSIDVVEGMKNEDMFLLLILLLLLSLRSQTPCLFILITERSVHVVIT